MSGNQRQGRSIVLCNEIGEKDFLGGCLVNEVTFWNFCDRIRADQFAIPRHAKIWSAMLELAASGKSVTKRAVPLYIKGDAADDIEILAYLNVLANDAPPASIVGDTLETLLSLATRRAVIEALEKAKNLILSSNMAIPPAEVVDAAVNIVAAAGTGQEDVRVKTIGEWGRDLDREIVEAMRQPDDNLMGYRSNLRAVDEILGLMGPGELIVLAGLSGGGKSALARQMGEAMTVQEMARAAREHRAPGWGYVFSMEMGGTENVARSLSEMTGFSYEKIKHAEMSAQEAQIVKQMIEQRLANLPILIDERGRQNMDDLRTRLMQARRRRGRIAWGIVDHLLLIEGRNKRDEEFQKIKDAATEAKVLAKEFGIPMILLAQLKNSVYDNARGRPSVKDLYGGSVIVQNADKILFVHREEQVLKDKEPDINNQAERHTKWAMDMLACAGKSEVYSGKRRGGKPAQSRPLYFDGETMTFRDV